MKECQSPPTSDSGTVRERSSSVSRNAADRRRLLNCSGTTKLEKFTQTDKQTDKSRRQAYVRDVNVADPAVPLFIKNAQSHVKVVRAERISKKRKKKQNWCL